MAGCITGTAEGGSGNDVGDTKSILQHNAHFLDKRYQKGRQRVAQKRHLLHHVDHVTVSRFFMACAVSQAQNGFPRLTRPVFRRRLPVQHIAWTASTTNTDGPSYFLLTSSLLQHANRPHNFLTQPSLNYLNPPQDCLPHARFCSNFQLVSRLYIAVLTYTSGLSSL
jgi:hypothetical protein